MFSQRQDVVLYQHVKDPKHYRGNQKPNTLDLLVINEEGMIDNIEFNAPIGKSHHVCINFEYNCPIYPPQRRLGENEEQCSRNEMGDPAGIRCRISLEDLDNQHQRTYGEVYT